MFVPLWFWHRTGKAEEGGASSCAALLPFLYLIPSVCHLIARRRENQRAQLFSPTAKIPNRQGRRRTNLSDCRRFSFLLPSNSPLCNTSTCSIRAASFSARWNASAYF